jgi:hypothetical protein
MTPLQIVEQKKSSQVAEKRKKKVKDRSAALSRIQGFRQNNPQGVRSNIPKRQLTGLQIQEPNVEN